MLTTGWRTLPTCYCFLYASYPQINTPILRISVAIRKGINTSFSLKDTSRPPCRECETFSVNNVLEGLLW